MPSYPGEIYEPREIENRPEAEYDPTKKRIFFAEDHNYTNDEIVAIETELGTNPKGIYDSVKENLEAIWAAIAGFATSFLELTDTPASYEGQKGKAAIVKATEDGLEFGDVGAGPHAATHENEGDDEINVAALSGELADEQKSNFLKLSDTPASYEGQAGKFAKVKATEDGLEFGDVTIPTQDITAGTETIAGITRLVDTGISNTAPTNAKEFLLGKATGTIKVGFTLHCLIAGYAVYGRIYKNGVAFGTQRSRSTIGTTYYEENLAFTVGDRIQLYCWTVVNGKAGVSNFVLRITDKTLGHIATETLDYV